MSIIGIQKAAADHLLTMNGGYRVVWQNLGDDTTTPRLEVHDGPVMGRRILLDRTEEIKALLQITAIVSSGDGNNEILDMVEAVTKWFSRGTKIGKAEVIGTPIPAPSQASESEYRISITIQYLAFL